MLSLLDEAKNMEKENYLLPAPVVLRDRESQMIDAYEARMVFEFSEHPTCTGFQGKQTYTEVFKNYSIRPIEGLAIMGEFNVSAYIFSDDLFLKLNLRTCLFVWYTKFVISTWPYLVSF
ncbi:MAG TPA: hypothetical protein VGO47_00245 [Chlamydiales bacterium]|nr:hypothetical protein [Chlamydiales bacterium]